MEKAEHERGVALRKELIRQEKLELLAQRFDHKTTMRQAWLNENQRLVSQVGGQMSQCITGTCFIKSKITTFFVFPFGFRTILAMTYQQSRQR